MKHSISVGIDIGTSQTRVVVCEAVAAHGSLPRALGASIVPTRGVRHGYIVDKAETVATLSRALHEAQEDSGHKIKHASLAIGGVGLSSEYALGASIVARADSVISKLDVDKAIADAESKVELKNKVILHAFPVLFRVDGKEIPARPEGVQGFKLEIKVLFITSFQQHIDDLLACLAESGVKVTSFTATPIATEQLILTDLQRNFGCALIDIGAETTSVAVYENGTLASLHVFGIGSLDITKDIALGLRVTPEEAENIKLGVIGFQTIQKKRLDDIVEARLSDIFELIDKYFKKIGRSGLLPAGAIIIGGGAQSQLIETVAKNMLRIPAKVAFLEYPTATSARMSKDQRLLVAYGVATSTVDRVANKPSSHADGDGFLATIKHFFKQLMP